MKPSVYAPMYCALYPQLAEITRKHGYALAVHGTLQRDMDLICVPWVESPSEPADVVKEITTEFAIKLVGGPPAIKEHGREAWTISIGFGECFIDLSFMPRIEQQKISPPVQVEQDVTINDAFVIRTLSELTRRGASPAGLSLAAQLLGVSSCSDCGYRKLHCRCTPHAVPIVENQLMESK